jgi:putative aldouronate transport system permease protein
MVVQDRSAVSRLFDAVNYSLMALLALVCLLPLVHVFAVSLSNNAAASANLVGLVPVGLNIENYKEAISYPGFVRAGGISIARTVLGASINMFLVVLAAYPLSREREELRGRNALMWVFFFATIFNGGLIPTFLVIKNLGLLDRFWVLIFNPTLVPVFNVILMMNFFRSIPRSLYDAALIDGAPHLTVLFRIYIPLSMAALATLTLFALVMHWNEWLMGVLYMNRTDNYPLQTFLRTLILDVNISELDPEDFARMDLISNRAFKSAQIFITTLPILLSYPFLQKYFVKGVKLGSVKE